MKVLVDLRLNAVRDEPRKKFLMLPAGIIDSKPLESTLRSRCACQCGAGAAGGTAAAPAASAVGSSCDAHLHAGLGQHVHAQPSSTAAPAAAPPHSRVFVAWVKTPAPPPTRSSYPPHQEFQQRQCHLLSAFDMYMALCMSSASVLRNEHVQHAKSP